MSEKQCVRVRVNEMLALPSEGVAARSLSGCVLAADLEPVSNRGSLLSIRPARGKFKTEPQTTVAGS